MTFPEFLTEEGFQADACQSCIHPDFYRLARSLYHRTRILERELGHANERCLRIFEARTRHVWEDNDLTMESLRAALNDPTNP